MRAAITHVTRDPSRSKAQIVVFTDGACKGNPGIGGWGFATFRADDQIGYQAYEREEVDLQRFGGSLSTTNNRMELTAVIEALGELAGKQYRSEGVAPTLLICVDSEYVLKGVTEWVDGWRRKGWIKADKKPVVNSDLWKQLLVEIEQFDAITWCWVRGHSGHRGNELADQLSNKGVEAIRKGNPGVATA